MKFKAGDIVQFRTRIRKILGSYEDHYLVTSLDGLKETGPWRLGIKFVDHRYSLAIGYVQRERVRLALGLKKVKGPPFGSPSDPTGN